MGGFQRACLLAAQWLPVAFTAARFSGVANRVLLLKKINGRKRHALGERQGLPLRFKVLRGKIQDRDGAKILLDEVKDQLPRLRLIWANGGYRGKLVEWVATTCAWLLQIVLRKDGVKGFHLLPRRWVVERPFAWLYRNRRLCKDYERQAASEEAFCYFAATLLIRV
jgi:putative transposase